MRKIRITIESEGMKTFKKLTDETIMPWGKYKGEELQDVPAGYLVWLVSEIQSSIKRSSFQNGLVVYVEENKDVLLKEINEKK